MTACEAPFSASPQVTPSGLPSNRSPGAPSPPSPTWSTPRANGRYDPPEKFDDKDLSYTDCISFVVMRARGLRRSFTFDQHFRDAGFVLWPSRQSRR